MMERNARTREIARSVRTFNRFKTMRYLFLREINFLLEAVRDVPQVSRECLVHLMHFFLLEKWKIKLAIG